MVGHENQMITQVVASVIFGHAVSNNPRRTQKQSQHYEQDDVDSTARIHQYSTSKFSSMVTVLPNHRSGHVLSSLLTAMLPLRSPWDVTVWFVSVIAVTAVGCR